MSVAGNVLRFTYDANGTPLTVIYNDITYYYVVNLQGDIVAILDSTGTAVVTYTYDAWGNILSTTGTHALATLNPLRYRGYVYDTETGLYYLQSRYYNPQWGRFITADCFVSTGQGVLGYNMFAYCLNNPINMSDPDGNCPQWAKNAIKWVAKEVVRPVVKATQNTLSKVDLTYSTGYSLSGSLGNVVFNGQLGVSMDTKGNVAVQGSIGDGIIVGSSGGAITRYCSITNASNIDKLNGPYYQAGGSIAIPVEGVPLAAGGDVMYIPDPESGSGYYGVTGNAGLGSPGGELHIEQGTTATVPHIRFNVFDVARSVYAKIMGW